MVETMVTVQHHKLIKLPYLCVIYILSLSINYDHVLWSSVAAKKLVITGINLRYDRWVKARLLATHMLGVFKEIYVVDVCKHIPLLNIFSSNIFVCELSYLSLFFDK